MARATKQRGISRSFPMRVGEALRCAPRGWPRGNARIGGIPRACVEDALMRVRAEKMKEPTNPINVLLGPQSLVGLFVGYQSRPKAGSCGMHA
jgi:hypothetical protein